MNRLRILFALIALLAAAVLIAAMSGCSGDNDQASRLARDADAERVLAADALRSSMLTIDTTMRNAVAGQPLPINQTTDDMTRISNQLNAGLAGLAEREAILNSAASLDISQNYRDYLKQLRTSNDLLTATLTTAQDIPRLILAEQYALAGWDEVRAQQVIGQIKATEELIAKLYGDAETSRNAAEQYRRDNPGEFGD